MAGLPFGENQDAFLPHRGEGTVACEPVREAIGVFQDKPPLGAAVDDLLMSGFDRSEISVVVGRRRVGRDFGAAADHAAAWAYEPEAPSTAYDGNDARTQAKSAIVAPRLFGRDGSRLADRRAVRAEQMRGSASCS